MEKQTPSSAMATQKDSHTISKHHQQPKIRIIHLFAPEIIKTDVSNFRELVQRLTGKHASDAGGVDNQNEKQLDISQRQQRKIQLPSLLPLDPRKENSSKGRRRRALCKSDDDDDDNDEEEEKEVEVKNVYNEEMAWKRKGEDNHHGNGFGFLETFFGEMEGFKHKIDGDDDEQLDEFSSLLPMDASSYMHAFEAAQLA